MATQEPPSILKRETEGRRRQCLPGREIPEEQAELGRGGASHGLECEPDLNDSTAKLRRVVHEESRKLKTTRRPRAEIGHVGTQERLIQATTG